MSRRPTKDMKIIREQIGQIVNEMQVMSLAYTANEIAEMTETSVETVTRILREFGLKLDGSRWYFENKK